MYARALLELLSFLVNGLPSSLLCSRPCKYINLYYINSYHSSASLPYVSFLFSSPLSPTTHIHSRSVCILIFQRHQFDFIVRLTEESFALFCLDLYHPTQRFTFLFDWLEKISLLSF